MFLSSTSRTVAYPTVPIAGGVAFNQVAPPSTLRTTWPPLSTAIPQPFFSSWKSIRINAGDASTGSAGGRDCSVGTGMLGTGLDSMVGPVVLPGGILVMAAEAETGVPVWI